MNKQFFSMLTLGVFSVAIAGFGIPAEGGLFSFFGLGSHNSDCGSVVDCSPVCGSCDYDDDDDDSCDYDDDDDDSCDYDDDDDSSCDHDACDVPAPDCATPPPVSD